MAALTVCLLGGESSGKSTLAGQLTEHLQGAGIRTARVDEHLRSWCEAAGRAPHAHEQAELAREQTRRIEAAALSGAQVVIADTTAVMPFDFTKLLWAALIGYLAFGQVPDVWVWIGGAVIFSSTVYLTYREARLARAGRLKTREAAPLES